MIQVKVQMVIMSHLSDIQADVTNSSNNTRINFIKFLISNYPNVLDEIEVDKVFEFFLKKYNK
jgi:hypothetical protein